MKGAVERGLGSRKVAVAQVVREGRLSHMPDVERELKFGYTAAPAGYLVKT